MTSPAQRRPAIGFVETLVVVPGRALFCVYRNVSIGVWVAQADREAAEAALRTGKIMAERFQGRHSSAAFLIDGLPGPMPEAMPALTQLWSKRPDLACTAMIIEGAGFWGSGLRSMVNNIRREGGGEVPIKIGSTIGQIVDWLSELNERHTGVAIAPIELENALAHARKLGENVRTDVA